MRKLLFITIGLLFMMKSISYAASNGNPCQIDPSEYKSRLSAYNNCMIWGGGAVNPSKCEGARLFAQAYLDQQKTLCEIQKVNQSGSYENYVCKGDINCEKRYLMQQDYNKALQNQKVRVDANVNYSGGVNVNHSGGVNLNNSGSVDYNHYFRF